MGKHNPKQRAEDFVDKICDSMLDHMEKHYIGGADQFLEDLDEIVDEFVEKAEKIKKGKREIPFEE